MQRMFYSVLFVLAVAIALPIQATSAQDTQAMTTPQNGFTPGQIKYGPAPPLVPAGAQFVVLEGNPMAATGEFTVRLKMPAGYKLPPHWHPNRENVTVISGVLKVGMGDTFEEGKMKTYPQGGFVYLDPDMHHYAMASGATVVQVHGLSPFEFHYINPDDDPRNQKK
jgi:quercetin dioxygenase-like cupin family protein